MPAAGKKAKTLIAGLKVSDADRRKDWVERTTRSLAHALDVIRAENLNVVTRSARGTVDSPGRSGAQKAGLNRGMLASRPGLLLTRLEQTSTRQARNSQLRTRRRPVNAGTHFAAQSRQSHATFVCVSCGHPGNGEVNAARKIAPCHGVTARGDRRALARSVKREPPHARPFPGRMEGETLVTHGREDVTSTFWGLLVGVRM